MRSPLSSPHVFATCRIGADRALRAEVDSAFPTARPAFSRPGFATFRLDDAVGIEALPRLSLARSWGLSLGRVEREHIVERLSGIGEPAVLHAWTRGSTPDEEVLPASWTDALRRAEGVLDRDEARDGDLVIDVIEVDPGQYWIGAHRHHRWRSPWAGGQFPVALPENAPSRAWRKIEEAILWGKLPFRRGQRVFEFGCAPGGATFAMLSRGLTVIGVDPAPMHASVLSFGDRFVHHAVPVGALQRSEFPEAIDWFVIDLGIAPQKAIRSMQRFFPPYRKSLLGVVWTLKMNDWSFFESSPRWREQLAEFGLEELHITQLPANRQECCLVGLTARGIEVDRSLS